MTHRQFSAWEEWDQESWNRPGLVEHYLAAIRADIGNMFAKRGSKAVRVESKLLKFEPKRKARKMSPEDRAKLARAAHLGHFPPGAVKVVYKKREEVRDGGEH
jgi:hypothetical protein